MPDTPSESAHALVMLGWREWISLPDLHIRRIKAKIDTGARTSALHAIEIEPYKIEGEHWVRFYIRPFQKRLDRIVTCVSKVKDLRWVSDSGGHRERRYIIETHVCLGGFTQMIEVSLTNRDPMRFRMLLGRTALSERFCVNPSLSFVTKKARSL